MGPTISKRGARRHTWEVTGARKRTKQVKNQIPESFKYEEHLGSCGTLRAGVPSSALSLGLRSGEQESVFAVKHLWNKAPLQSSPFAKPPLKIHFYQEAEPDALRALSLQFASSPVPRLRAQSRRWLALLFHPFPGRLLLSFLTFTRSDEATL